MTSTQNNTFKSPFFRAVADTLTDMILDGIVAHPGENSREWHLAILRACIAAADADAELIFDTPNKTAEKAIREEVAGAVASVQAIEAEGREVVDLRRVGTLDLYQLAYAQIAAMFHATDDGDADRWEAEERELRRINAEIYLRLPGKMSQAEDTRRSRGRSGK